MFCRNWRVVKAAHYFLATISMILIHLPCLSKSFFFINRQNFYVLCKLSRSWNQVQYLSLIVKFTCPWWFHLFFLWNFNSLSTLVKIKNNSTMRFSKIHHDTQYHDNRISYSIVLHVNITKSQKSNLITNTQRFIRKSPLLL